MAAYPKEAHLKVKNIRKHLTANPLPVAHPSEKLMEVRKIHRQKHLINAEKQYFALHEYKQATANVQKLQQVQRNLKLNCRRL